MIMGRGIFCAICGGPFHNGGLVPPDGYRYPEDSDILDAIQLRRVDGWYDEEYCDNTVLDEQSVAWLRDLRAIGKTKHEAFITGTGFESERTSGEVTVDPGDDDNVPKPHELLHQDQPGKLRLDVYYTDPIPLWHNSYPVHVKCFDILRQAHNQRSSSSGREHAKLDLNSLHKAMRRCEALYESHLNLSGYAEFRESLGQWWEGPCASLEPWYHDPVDVPVLNALNIRHERRRVRIWASSAESAANCLSGMPVELLILIARLLDVRSIIQLTLTCREVNAILSKNLWRRKLFDDMSYLFEIQQAVAEDSSISDAIDWQDLYGRMLLQSYPGCWDRVWWKFTDPSRKLPQNADWLLEHLAGCGRGGLLQRGTMVSKYDPTLIGIASRRRVWRCAEELLDVCEKYAHDGSAPESDTEPEDEDEYKDEE